MYSLKLLHSPFNLVRPCSYRYYPLLMVDNVEDLLVGDQPPGLGEVLPGPFHLPSTRHTREGQLVQVLQNILQYFYI